MAAVLDDAPARRVDPVDGRSRGREDPAVEHGIAAAAIERRRRAVEHYEVGPGAGRDRGRVLSKRARPTDRRGIEEPPPRGAAVRRRQPVAGAVAQTLAVFERAELRRSRDQHVGIAADPEGPAGLGIGGGRKDAVAEVAFGDRAEPRHGARSGHAGGFIGRHVGGMNEAPSRVDLGVVEQPFDGPGAGRGDAVLHLADLFGDVDMNRAFGERREEGRDLVGRGGAERMRRDADAAGRQHRDGMRRPFDQACIEVQRRYEAPLPGRRSRAAEAPMRVEDRQQRKADPGRGGGGGDAPREFGRVVVGASIGGVMQVVEFCDPGEAAFQHFGKSQPRDGLDVLRREASAEAVHGLPPGPEMIVARSTPLGQPGEAALERVAVEVAEARHRDTAPLV